jgi:hypothetical protein
MGDHHKFPGSMDETLCTAGPALFSELSYGVLSVRISARATPMRFI